MQSNSPVEIADRFSRVRAGLTAAAAAIFLVVQVISRPYFTDAVADTARRGKIDLWAVNAAILLLLLGTGGGLLQSRQVRSLVNDEVARSNYRKSVIAGYWVAMVVAMGLYVASRFYTFAAREAIYAIVSSSLVVALFAFSFLEYRAHRDA
jgi:hypothetical protein